MQVHRLTIRSLLSPCFAIAALFGCKSPGPNAAKRDATPAPSAAEPAAVETRLAVDLKGHGLSHPTPYIPSQCYTKTVDDDGEVHNPCYVCHQTPTSPNYLDDHDVQQSYSFIPDALDNPWTNLFVDRRAAIAEVSDDEILAYVRRSNYLDDHGEIRLASLAKQVPEAWDVDDDDSWDGYVPDAYLNFDEDGWDRDPSGAPTGWRAFAYHPFPGTFWPTNGSTGDVMIRLPEAYRRTAEGGPSLEVYAINLAVVETYILRRDTPIEAVDESRYGVDLDGDGTLGEATEVRYQADPARRTFGHYVGQAGAKQDAGEIDVRPGLYPLGTEFLHTVRYIDVVDGRPRMAARLKELRYMRKTRWYTAGQLEQATTEEVKDKHDFPDRPKEFAGSSERGIGNKLGWTLAGFIEDGQGDLRPQSREEQAFCIGCHGGIGAIEDSVFSFRRKIPAAEADLASGWYHWTQKGLQGTPEPVRADGEPEYAHYLRHNGAGDELRANREVLQRFFADDGRTPDHAALAALRRDVSTLLLPSPERALAMNKAYREIVREQSFIRGRDANVAPATNVHRRVEADQSTGVEIPLTGPRTPSMPAAIAAK